MQRGVAIKFRFLDEKNIVLKIFSLKFTDCIYSSFRNRKTYLKFTYVCINFGLHYIFFLTYKYIIFYVYRLTYIGTLRVRQAKMYILTGMFIS